MHMFTTERENREQGFAALVVAITLVIVLSLLTVGFAQLMRNEQNQVTNRQLSNQAYYAAESGVNDAAKALQLGYTKHKTSCGPETSAEVTPLYDTTASWPYLSDQNVGSTDTQWTCLLIDPAPTSLEYKQVDTVTPNIFTASGADGTPVKRLTFYWQDSAPGVTSFRGSTDTSFPPAGGWGAAPGVLRIAITPLTNTAAVPLNRANLIADTYTAFLYPSGDGTSGHSGTGTYTTDPTKQGDIISGHCNTLNTTATNPRYCSVTIDFSADTTHFGGGTPILFDLRSIYTPTDVKITQDDGTPGDLIRFSGAQAEVDSTGRAQDVLKRIQVRIPLRDTYYSPAFSLGSLDGICKQLVLPFEQTANGCPLPSGP